MAKNIMVVDDSSVMRKIVIRAIRQTGLAVAVSAEAGNGLEALEALKTKPVDLVICDWNMPEMDGLEFIKVARETYTMPIMMLTTEGTQDRISTAMSAGANGYLTKPFEADDIAKKLSTLLEI